MTTRERYQSYAAVGPPGERRRYYLGTFATEAEALHEARNAVRVYHVAQVRKVQL